MNSSIDLHCHTTASDGSLEPADLVRRAAERGIETLAITDHDTLEGFR
ncbi:MAG: PHP domain-containing protein, partial [Thalassolituus sp.]